MKVGNIFVDISKYSGENEKPSEEGFFYGCMK